MIFFRQWIKLPNYTTPAAGLYCFLTRQKANLVRIWVIKGNNEDFICSEHHFVGLSGECENKSHSPERIRVFGRLQRLYVTTMQLKRLCVVWIWYIMQTRSAAQKIPSSTAWHKLFSCSTKLIFFFSIYFFLIWCFAISRVNFLLDHLLLLIPIQVINPAEVQHPQWHKCILFILRQTT